MLKGKKVAILATNGFEQSELTVPLETLQGAGLEVSIVSLDADPIRGEKGGEWQASIDVDMTLDQVSARDFDALVIPGGVYNPDKLRTDERAVQFVRDMFKIEKPIAAICHGPWLLIEAGVLEGRRATSYHSIRTDMQNAGADWVDQEVVVDKGIVTSRSPDDLKAFCTKVIEEIGEGRHQQRFTAVG